MFSIDRFVDILVSIETKYSLSMLDESIFRELMTTSQHKELKMEMNLFCMALNLGIVKDIAESKSYNYLDFSTHVSLLETEYGVSKINAQSLIISICQGCKIDLRFLPALQVIEQDESLGEEIEQFFSASLAAAGQHLPIPLGHTLYISSDVAKRKAFIEQFVQVYETCYQSSCVRELALSRSMKEGDLTSILVNGSGNMSLFYSNECTIDLSPSGLQAMYKSMSEGSIAIMIGKGPTARSITLQLPPFLILTCVSRTTKTIEELIPVYRYVFRDE